MLFCLGEYLFHDACHITTGIYVLTLWGCGAGHLVSRGCYKDCLCDLEFGIQPEQKVIFDEVVKSRKILYLFFLLTNKDIPTLFDVLTLN